MDIHSTTSTVTVVRLVVDGRLDAETAPALRDAITAHIEHGVVNLVVDMTSISFVDSAGLAALVSGMKRSRQAGGDLQLVRPTSTTAFRVFELTQFDQIFRFVDPT